MSLLFFHHTYLSSKKYKCLDIYFESHDIVVVNIYIPEKKRVRIEKYITGIVNKNESKLYAFFANPEHVHFLVSSSPSVSEEELSTSIADSLEKFINENKLGLGPFSWQSLMYIGNISILCFKV